MPENVPAPVPVRPEIVEAAIEAYRRDGLSGPAHMAQMSAALDAVAPLIAAEAAARERERIIELLRGHAKDRANLVADALYALAREVESLPAPGPEETT